MPGISKAAKPELAQSFEALRAIVGEGGVRRGINADGVCGAFPGLCVEPADEAELSRVLRYANEAELMVSPRGGGTKLEWGSQPEGVDIAISTAHFSCVLEYAPHDMTVTVGAGVSIAQLQSTLETHGQRLALDPLWPERATVGGVIATNDSGALRVRYGGIRDLIIGATIVLADGTIAASGGKVVKNVAGYDLPKLMAGSLGTLGIITRAVFRLHPLPESSQTLTWKFADCERAKDFVLAVADSQVVTSGLQMRTGEQGSSGDGSAHVDVRIDGIAPGIEAQMQIVRKLAEELRPTETASDPWQMREQLWGHGGDATPGCILKLSILPTQLASVAEFVRSRLGRSGGILLMHSTGLGWLRLDFNAEGSSGCAQAAEFISVLRALLAPTGGSAVLLRAPNELRRAVDVWGDLPQQAKSRLAGDPNAGSAFPLMMRIKQQFDPRGILNRGRFVGGI